MMPGRLLDLPEHHLRVFEYQTTQQWCWRCKQTKGSLGKAWKHDHDVSAPRPQVEVNLSEFCGFWREGSTLAFVARHLLDSALLPLYFWFFLQFANQELLERASFNGQSFLLSLKFFLL